MGTFKIRDLMVTLAPEDAACAEGLPSVVQPLCGNSPEHIYQIIDAIAELGAAELAELKAQLKAAMDQATAREQELTTNANVAGQSPAQYELEALHKRLTAAAESVLTRIHALTTPSTGGSADPAGGAKTD